MLDRLVNASKRSKPEAFIEATPKPSKSETKKDRYEDNGLAKEEKLKAADEKAVKRQAQDSNSKRKTQEVNGKNESENVVEIGDLTLQDDPIMDSLQIRMGLGMNPITHIQMSEQDFQAADPDSLIEGMIDKIYSSQESTEMDGGNILGEHLQVINSL